MCSKSRIDKSVATRTISTVWILLLVVLLSFPVIPAEAAPNNSMTVNIHGNPTVFATPALDLCGTVHLGSCPIYFTMKENYAQGVLASFNSDKTTLQPSDSTMVTATVNPSSPSVSFDFILTFGSKSYTYNYPLSSLPAIGSGSLASVPIPIGIVTAALGLPPLPITLNVGLQVSSVLIGDLQGTGFAGSSPITWSAPGTQQLAVGFHGNTETATIDLNTLKSQQDWQVSISAGVPIVGSVQLYSTSIQKLQVSSEKVNVFSWYHISVSTQYSTASGSGWYLSGTSATLSVADNAVSITQKERRAFVGWAGTGSGSYSGSAQSTTAVANAPISEVAQWKTQYLLTIEQPLGGAVSPSPGSQWYDNGYQLDLQAMPATSFQFKDWLINSQVVSSTASFSYTVKSPADIKAEFAQVQSPVPGIDINTILIAGAIVIAAGVIGFVLRRRQT